MVGRNKRKGDDDVSSSSDDEVLANIKKPGTSKRNRSKSNHKNSSGKTKGRSNKTSATDDESDNQPTSDDDSGSEIKTKRSSEKRNSGRRHSKKETLSRPKRMSEPIKKRSLDRRETTRNVDDSDGSEAEENNGKESPMKKQSSLKRKSETEPKKSKKEKEEEYEVEEILDFKIEDKAKQFLVRWKGYDSSADSWVFRRDLHCTGLIKEFYKNRPEARVTTHKRKKNRDPFKPKTKKPVRNYPPPELKIDERPDYDSEAFDENQDWKVEKIIDVRFHRDSKRDFLIRWEGFSSKSDSWEPEENLDCKELIKKFMAKLESIANVTVKELRAVRKPTQRYTVMDKAHGRRLSRRFDGRQRAAYYDCE